MKKISCFFMLTIFFLFARLFNIKSKQFRFVSYSKKVKFTNKAFQWKRGGYLWEGKMEKVDVSSAYRRMKSPNIKTRKRALKIIHTRKHNKNK